MLLALLLFVGPRCAHIPRSGDRTTVTGAAHVGRAQDISRGCEGELIDSESHQLVGGSVSVDHDTRSGLGAGGGINIGHAEVVAATGDLPGSAPTRYMFGSTSAYLSMDSKTFGVDIGASLLLAGGDVTVAPLTTLKFGAIDRVWLELAVGPHDGYLDGEMLGLHLAGQTDDFSLRVGFGGYARPLLSRDSGIVFGTDDISLWAGVRFDASVRVTDRWALAGGFVASNTWSGWLGLKHSFGTSAAGPEPDPAAELPPAFE